MIYDDSLTAANNLHYWRAQLSFDHFGDAVHVAAQDYSLLESINQKQISIIGDGARNRMNTGFEAFLLAALIIC